MTPIEASKVMTAEEVAAENRRLAKQLAIKITIFVVFKVSLYYGINRWAKSVRESN